nr:RNA polymerase sigma factor [Alcaligenes faecalis]
MARIPTPKLFWLATYRELIGVWSKLNSRPQDAQDATQDTALRMLTRKPSAILDSDSYLYRSVRNNLISTIRRQDRHPGLSLEELTEADLPANHDPDHAIRLAQLTQALEQALSELPLKKRQAYIWHKLEGYSQAETAQKMGVSVSTVERYILESTRSIRAKLQDFCP